MNKTITTVEDHMKSLGLSHSRKIDLYLYATLLDSGAVHAPRSLRGTKRDSVSGRSWKRKLEFIVKHRYDVELKDVAYNLCSCKIPFASFDNANCLHFHIRLYPLPVKHTHSGALLFNIVDDSKGREHISGYTYRPTEF